MICDAVTYVVFKVTARVFKREKAYYNLYVSFGLKKNRKPPTENIAEDRAFINCPPAVANVDLTKPFIV